MRPDLIKYFGPQIGAAPEPVVRDLPPPGRGGGRVSGPRMGVITSRITACKYDSYVYNNCKHITKITQQLFRAIHLGTRQLPRPEITIITSCSNRKHRTGSRTVGIRTLPRDSLHKVAKLWAKTIRSAPKTRMASDLYMGRGFCEALACKALAGARLYVVSAGLGLIEDDALVPVYDLTIGDSASNIGRKVVGEPFSCRNWWLTLNGHGISAHRRGIAGLIEEFPKNLYYIALPSTYLDMVADDLARLPGRLAKRVRIFSSVAARGVLASKLLPNVMPYDARLDGPDSPIPGTKSDFAQRALQHYLQHISSYSMRRASLDAGAVRRALGGMRYPHYPKRRRLTDKDLKALMTKHYAAVSGRSSAMLMYLRRKLGVACEQGRFAKLFRELKTSREN